MQEEKKDLDVMSKALSLVERNMAKGYQDCGQEILELSNKGKIETELDEKVAMLCVKILSSYYAYTSEWDLAFLGLSDSSFNYDNTILHCGNKICDCKRIQGEKCPAIKKVLSKKDKELLS